MSEAERIQVANRVLATFCRDAVIYRGRELRVQFPVRNGRADYPIRLRYDGHWAVSFPKALGFPGGGTAMLALCTLVQYIRDEPRLPIVSWRWWASETVQLLPDGTHEILLEGGYEGAKTACVLCGSEKFKGGLDWWSLDGTTGPCCQFGACREQAVGAR